ILKKRENDTPAQNSESRFTFYAGRDYHLCDTLSLLNSPKSNPYADEKKYNKESEERWRRDYPCRVYRPSNCYDSRAKGHARQRFSCIVWGCYESSQSGGFLKISCFN